MKTKMHNYKHKSKNLKLLGNKKTNYNYNNADYKLLERFDNTAKLKQSIKITVPEFTSLCPKTGQPDFATILIYYIPDKYCVESKSLKLYLGSYRMFGEFHEDCVDRIMKDLIQLLSPKYIKVIGKFNPRGGISFHPTSIWKKK